MKRKTGLTFEEHQRLGAELYQMSRQLSNILIILANKYPMKRLNKVPVQSMICELKKVKSGCEKLLFEDHYKKGDDDLKFLQVYYPHSVFEDGKIIPLTRGRLREG